VISPIDDINAAQPENPGASRCSGVEKDESFVVEIIRIAEAVVEAAYLLAFDNQIGVAPSEGFPGRLPVGREDFYDDAVAAGIPEINFVRETIFLAGMKGNTANFSRTQNSLRVNRAVVIVACALNAGAAGSG
jgi:hypothetical protein